MCFSATASFGAATVLTGLGAINLRMCSSKEQRMFAAIPLVFGLQQASEGFVWLGMQHAQFVSILQIAIYAFLGFAQLVWPWYVPLSILLITPKENRSKWQHYLLYSGIVISAGVLFFLFKYPVSAVISGHHMLYREEFLQGAMQIGSMIYILTIILSPFLSRVDGMKWVGICTLVSYLTAQILFPQYVVSVWCYFAALISISCVRVIYRMNPLNSFSKLLQ